MRAFNELNVPCGPILDMSELAVDPSLRDRQTVVEVTHPERGSFLTVGCPIKLSSSPVEITTSPLLGEHTDQILKDLLGYDDARIATARQAGAI